MFTSENNYSYPNLFYDQSPSFTNIPLQISNSLFLQHNHGSFSYLLPTTNPPISENPMNKLVPDHQAPINYPENPINYPSKNAHLSSKRSATTKKDRHTKISTAQGLRDRRVRLSINIARKFFTLQDMLGFDKASKTLGWLLANSKAAINELVKTSNNTSGSHSPLMVNEDIINGGDEEKTKDMDNNEKSSSSKKKKSVDGVAKEVMRRAKARQRARERTEKKTKKKEKTTTMLVDQNNNQRVQQNLKGLSSYNCDYNCNHDCNYKKCSKKDDDDHQEGSNYYYSDYYLNKFASGSNGGGLIQSPVGFPALSVINLSTEIHINAKPWNT